MLDDSFERPNGLAFSPDERVLYVDDSYGGHIEPPEIPANLAWGDDDLKTLYITARTGLYRIRIQTGGVPLVGD